MPQRKKKGKVLRQLVTFSFLFPAAAIFVFVLLIPFIQGFWIAFTDWNGISPTYNFIGLDNIKFLLHDKQSLNAIWNTLYYTLLTCIGVNALALVLTLALNHHVFGRKFLQSVMFLPMITSLVIAAFMWLRIYSDVFPVNFGVASPLTASSTVIPGIALICLWRDTGLAMVIYNAGLQSVPEDLREAAQIDGCNPYGPYFRIVFPLLKPITMTVVVLAALGIWNDYQIALVVILKEPVRTLPVAQQDFIGQQISYHNLAAAACLLSIIPMFILFVFLQKFIVKGIAAGAIKG